MACIEGRKRHSYPKEGPRTCLACGQTENVSGAPTTTDAGEASASSLTSTTPPEGEMLPFVTAPTDSVSVTLPDATSLAEHSPLGASSAERWMECPGSVSLVKHLRRDPAEPDPEWTLDGTEAHAMAAYVLMNNLPEAWMAMDPVRFPRVTVAMAAAVQKYVDFVRSLGGRQEYEMKLHTPDLHPLMYGTADCVAYHPAAVGDQPVLEVVDYKNGAGVYVEVKANVQLMYYACMAIYLYDCVDAPEKVRLTIVQPNAGGPVVRSWDTTVGFLRAWLAETLIPAMNRAHTGSYLSLGKWCQFCPAKLVCPAMQELLRKFAQKTDAVDGVSNEMLGMLRDEVRTVSFAVKEINEEVYKRLMNGQDIPGSKLIYGRSNRVWKEGAEEAAKAAFGGASYVYSEPAFLSVAQIEKLPGGTAFVAEWAMAPLPGLAVAYADNPKPGQRPKDATELLSSVSDKKLVDAPV